MSSASPSTATSPARADARLNRERLLVAAVTELAEHGERVPMAQIAARAGVGIGTVYRHFPNREALLAALTRRAFEQVLARARAAAEADGPAIDAVAAFLEQGIRHRRDLILPLHGGPARLDAGSRALQAEIRSLLADILERGRRDGSIRGDVMPRDVVIAGAQLAQPLAGVSDWDRQARRQARLIVAGLAPER